MSEFSTTFNQLLAKSQKSLTKVATLSGVDRAYCLRLSNGTKDNPSNATILRLYIACVMDEELVSKDPTIVHALEELLMAAAYDSTRKMTG